MMTTNVNLMDQVNAQAGYVTDADRSGDDDLIREWINDALDIQVTVTSSLLVDTPDAYVSRKLSVLVTFGGPNVWVDLDRDESQMLTVRGYWGGDEYVAHVNAPNVARVLNDVADMYMGLA